MVITLAGVGRRLSRAWGGTRGLEISTDVEHSESDEKDGASGSGSPPPTFERTQKMGASISLPEGHPLAESKAIVRNPDGTLVRPGLLLFHAP